MKKDICYFLHMNEQKDISIFEESNENALVFHYTKMKSFEKIVNNQSFWFTDYRYLNDTQEFNWGKGQIINVLESMKSKNAKSILDEIDYLENVELYVASFCLQPDLLSQWRAYGNNGKGVSFGVNPIKMKNSLGFSFFQGKVKYNRSEQRKQIIEAINESFDYFKKKGEIPEIKCIIRYLSLIIATHKHESFFEEKEYRLFVFSNTSQRDAWLEEGLNSEGKPYFSFHTLGKIQNLEIKELFPIDKIFIGPSRTFHTSKKSVSKLLKVNGYNLSSSNIIKSEIPYRC